MIVNVSHCKNINWILFIILDIITYVKNLYSYYAYMWIIFSNDNLTVLLLNCMNNISIYFYISITNIKPILQCVLCFLFFAFYILLFFLFATVLSRIFCYIFFISFKVRELSSRVIENEKQDKRQKIRYKK